MWTIYGHPRDYPSGYVVRGCSILPGVDIMDAKATYHPSLEAARSSLPAGLHRMPRDMRDDPVIVEVWL